MEITASKIKIKYSEQQLAKIGLQCLRLIRQRTLSGIDKDGNAFKPYSKRAFTMPASWFRKNVITDMINTGEAQYFKDNSGRLYVFVKTGYLGLKLAYAKRAGGYGGIVNLTLTGGMLRGFNVIHTDTNRIVLGWNRADLAERASGNIARGRDFLGLSPADLNDNTLNNLLLGGELTFE